VEIYVEHYRFPGEKTSLTRMVFGLVYDVRAWGRTHFNEPKWIG